MYLRRLAITNIRSIRELAMEFKQEQEAGWHVILGQNGSGKSTVVRSFALLMMGEREAYAARQDFSRWIGKADTEGSIQAVITSNDDFDVLSGGGRPPKRPIKPHVSLKWAQEGPTRRVDIAYDGEQVNRTVWGAGNGWFAASFGPFRRFTGGDRIYDRLFVSNRRLAPHLSALGEDVALTEALGWLTSLHVQQLQAEKNNIFSRAQATLELVKDFLNNSLFLPHTARVHEVTNDQVLVKDGNGSIVSIDQLSDGYRSALSLTLELIRQMFELYGFDTMYNAMSAAPGHVNAPGVVAIDEVDAHLHPSWQRDIGRWLTKNFPKVQFIVTTHSPIVCRAVVGDDGVERGTIWRLPAPGSGDVFRRVSNEEYQILAYGDVLDAFSTDLFGGDITRSPAGRRKLERLAVLNREALGRTLTDEEKIERRNLRSIIPSEAGTIEQKPSARC